jgi:hypothetical protein
MCPEFEILSAYFDGEIGSPWDKEIRSHCESCKECAEKLASLVALKDALQKDPEPDWHDSFDRVRTKIAFREEQGVRPRVPFWQQSIRIPIPAFALGLVLALAIGIGAFMNQPNGKVTIKTTSGDKGLEVIAPSSEEMEALLRALGNTGSQDDVVIKLPEGSKFDKFGEPTLIRSVDFKGNKQ